LLAGRIFPQLVVPPLLAGRIFPQLVVPPLLAGKMFCNIELVIPGVAISQYIISDMRYLDHHRLLHGGYFLRRISCTVELVVFYFCKQTCYFLM
jgi:hypothetical protein